MKKCLRHIPLLMVVAVAMTMALLSCSTDKNTAQTRWWHSFTAKYNTYYNGTLAYIDASLEKERAHKDNYTELLPLYTVSSKATREVGKGNYDRAIEKSQKTIKLHSINKRPEWTKNKKKTERDIEWLNRKEYNPFLWKAWMLMGRSQFHKGAFDDALTTFSYMCRLYKTQPAIYGKARAWLAKCYIEQGWLYDAEDIIRNMQRDSIDWRAQKEWDYTYTDYYLHTGDLENAAKYLRKVIKHEMRSKQRAREYFLLGQIEASQGNRQQAYKAFKKVLSQNPPYEMAFNTRIAMTEVLANAGQAKQMISRLKRMASNENNKDYLDQVYYAIGNIYLAQKDTANAIGAYEKGNEKATRSGIEKGVLLLHLGDLYWQKEKYSDAGRCYGEAIGLLDKDRPDYQQLSERSKVLDELVPHTDVIYLQDSLQALAKMDEKDRNAAIDRVITALKKKEKEERDKEEIAQAERIQAKNNTGANRNNVSANTQSQTGGAKNGAWYFYSPTAVQQGKQAFVKQWGKRENVDDWQRSNKTVVGEMPGMKDDEESNDTIANDSIAGEQENMEVDGKKKGDKDEKADSAALDPHKREYYLAQIPFTEEQLAESNNQIRDALFKSAVIFKDKLNNLPLSDKSFSRLMRDFPDFESMDEVYYHLFLLHSLQGTGDQASAYVEKLKEEYPESKWTTLLTDPYFEENARFGAHIEDSLYAATYNAFLNNAFDEVNSNTKLSDTRFVLGAHRDRFLFVSGLSMLNEGRPDSCVSRMEQLVKEFPQSKVSEMAGMIINGVKEGKKLRGANFSLADVWNRRTAVLADSDSIVAQKLSDERDIPFVFMLVYQPDSVDNNKLLYQLARFNFTNFVVRNFDMTLVDAGGVNRMQVSGFRSFDEARQYARVLFQNEAVKTLTQKCRPFVVSEKNLPMLGEQVSYNEYDTFYVEHFQSLDIEREYMLYEPDVWDEKNSPREVTPVLPSKSADPEGVEPVAGKKEDDSDSDEDEDEDMFDGVDNSQGVQKEEEIISVASDDTEKKEDGNDGELINVDAADDAQQTNEVEEVIAVEADNTVQKTDDELIVVGSDEEQQKKADDELIVVGSDDEKQQKTDDEIILVEDDKDETQQDDEFVITDDDKDEKAEDEIILLDESDEKENSKSTSNAGTGTASGQKENGQKDQKKDSAKTADSKAKTDKSKAKTADGGTEQKKKDSRELEDEYYELEGF